MNKDIALIHEALDKHEWTGKRKRHRGNTVDKDIIYRMCNCGQVQYKSYGDETWRDSKVTKMFKTTMYGWAWTIQTYE